MRHGRWHSCPSADGLISLYGETSIVVPPETEAAYKEHVKAVSGDYLAEIAAAARKADLRFEGIDVDDASPADAILCTAEEQVLRSDRIGLARPQWDFTQ